MPTIFIIVLNYNGKDTLLPCLASIYQSTYPKFEVVVVDNDSRDGSLELAKTQFSRAHFIKNSTNTGFASGNNLGIRFALEKFADYILVLNNDAYLKNDTLSKLVALAQDHPVPAVINPLILGRDDKAVWFAGGEIEWLQMKNTHLIEVASNKPYSTEYCTGCAMFINKAVFKKIGLFDERYFLYYEDSDFSVRAKKAGFDLLICPTATVTHLEQSNQLTELKTYWLVLSGLLFFSLHADFFQKIYLFPYLQLRKLKNFFKLKFKPSPLAFQVRQAYQDFRKIRTS
jgi:GT2 family glycosyltransferase